MNDCIMIIITMFCIINQQTLRHHGDLSRDLLFDVGRQKRALEIRTNVLVYFHFVETIWREELRSRSE